jgi:hypothetical protein
MHILRFDDFLSEARAQMELPFDGGKKPVHVDFVDALQNLAVKMDYRTSTDWDSVQQKAMEAGVKRTLDSVESEETNREVLILWAEMNEGSLDRSLFSERFAEDENMPDGQVPLDFFYDTDVLHQYGKDAFSEKGWALLRRQMPEVVAAILKEGWRGEQMFDEMRKSFVRNKGLIDCWRAVALDQSVEDMFKAVTDKYKGAGLYWSWSEDAAQPYLAAVRGKRVDATLFGKVRPEDVDWARTVYVNVYDLREEQEVSLKGHVQLDRVEFRDGGGRRSSVDLGGIVVPVGFAGSWLPYK